MIKSQHRLQEAPQKAEEFATTEASVKVQALEPKEEVKTSEESEEPIQVISLEALDADEESNEPIETVSAEALDVKEPETNQWLVDSPIDHCPICRDHWRTDLSGQPSCTSEPPLPQCPRLLS